MSSVVISGDISGSVTLDAPSVAGTTVLTLPATSGTVLTSASATVGANGITFSDGSTQTAAASPFVLKNRIINGAMEIDQRNAGAAVSLSNTNRYTLDRFYVDNVTDGVISVQQSTVAPNNFINSMGVTVTTADASIGATQYSFIRQNIEGFNVADLSWGTANAQTVTLSFWVRSSVTGTFGGSIQNSAENRAYAFTYTINSANTWEKETITIAGDTSGTWLTTNGVGLRLNFNLGTGTTYSSTANTWVAQTSFNATGSVALLNTLNATFYITGVQLEIGTTATPFERRLYGQELINCQRYYWEMARGSLSSNGTFSWMGNGAFYNTTQYNLPVMFPVTMRTSPTLNVSNTAAYFQVDTPAGQTFATFTIYQPSIYGTLIYATGLTGGTGGYGTAAFTRNSAAFCAFSAEL